MTMQTFTGKEYLQIDIANSFGYDKQDWSDRLAWFQTNEHQLHALVNQAEEPALFYAGILAWEKTKEGKPSSYPISLDATCSGIQILAALAGDRKAAEICNVVDTGHREDAYVSIYQDMVNTIGDTAKIDRKLTKKAIMTSFYGSTAQPKEVFGEGTLLQVFYDTMQVNAPGAWEINETMLAIWDENALVNEWVLPDNFHVVVKVMGTVTEQVHFMNEPFEISYQTNMPIKGGRSLGANMVHSIDGMMVREMQRRCNYDPAKIQELTRLLDAGAAGRNTHRYQDKLLLTLLDRFRQSGFFSARMLDLIDLENIGLVGHAHVRNLIASLPKKPFEVISVHDCFRCLPNYGNDLRQQYNNLLAEIAESNMLGFIVSQMVGKPIQINKLDPKLGHDIRQANYALS
ncbi:DNA-directed RNA polymerase [Mesorhizobium sp.]|uniref:DNA-directed RNA polymerase n=1 Tax=Mesorhizobium sp. TaxID=1871066 RepID=UPI0025F10B85|nr:DNA-directed RNA polymerase [Mesorhizobium sp.]